MTTTATYQGYLEPSDGRFTKSGLIYGDWKRDRLELRIVYRRDGLGQEEVDYYVAGKRSATLWLDGKTHIEIPPAPGMPNVRPLAKGDQQSPGGYATLGFILPPEVSSMFLHRTNKAEVLSGDGCNSGDAACLDYTVPLNLFGTELKFASTANKLTYSQSGHQLLQWEFQAGSSDLPKGIRYSERNDEGIERAHAEFSLISLKSDRANLVKADLIQPGRQTLVTQHGVSYGVAYDAKADPSQFHSAQAGLWLRHEAQAQPARPLGSGVLLVIGVLFVSGVTALALRWKRA